MAVTAVGARLTELHRQAQVRVGAQTVARMFDVWRLLDPLDVDGTAPAWLTAARGVVEAQHRVSADLAAAYLRRFRAVELAGVGETLAATAAGIAELLAPVVPPLVAEALTTSLLVTGPIAVKEGTRRGLPLEQVVAEARVASARSAMRHALAGGRDLILEQVERDERALGWARATSGSPCAFCAMLASRGPVYSSQETAAFQAHDGCSCTAEPVYDPGADWPPGARRFAELWQRAKQTRPEGVSTAVQFRRLVEGRAAV